MSSSSLPDHQYHLSGYCYFHHVFPGSIWGRMTPALFKVKSVLCGYFRSSKFYWMIDVDLIRGAGPFPGLMENKGELILSLYRKASICDKKDIN
jgi:hypothetical protein